MKKKFIIEVEIPNKKTNSFLDEIRQEIDQEQSEMLITKKINEEVSVIHYNILNDLVKQLNDIISETGISFEQPVYDSNTNGYRSCKSVLPNYTNLSIKGLVDVKFKESRYSTYTGNYQLKCRGYLVSSVEDILKVIKPYIKDRIIHNLELNS